LKENFKDVERDEQVKIEGQDNVCKKLLKRLKKKFWIDWGVLGNHNSTLTTTLKLGPQGVMSNAIKDLSVSSSSPVRFEVKWHSSWFDKWYQSQGHEFESQSVIVREGLLGDHNLTLYNHSKNRSALCDVECHKRFECVFLITNWFWGEMAQLTV